MLEEARFVIETHVSYSEESGPAEGGRIGFAIGERVFWTDAYFNESKRLFEAKRDYAKAIVAAINEGRMFAEVQPAAPAPGVLPPGWLAWDVSKGAPHLYGGSLITIHVMFKDGTQQPCTLDFDWMADRGDNPIIAYFDEIPF